MAGLLQLLKAPGLQAAAGADFVECAYGTLLLHRLCCSQNDTIVTSHTHMAASARLGQWGGEAGWVMSTGAHRFLRQGAIRRAAAQALCSTPPRSCSPQLARWVQTDIDMHPLAGPAAAHR